MSTETTQDPLVSRLNAALNEEKLSRDLSALQLARVKSLDDLLAEIESSGKKPEFISTLEDHLRESPESLVSRYILGRMYFATGKDEGMDHLKSLLEDFRSFARWPIVDHLADIVLASDDSNRIALRAKVDSTERLRGKKELRPFLEKLAAIDKKNPDVAKKYAMSILEEDPKTALTFLKQAGEAYARFKDYANLEDVWNDIVKNSPEDLSFFESVERILVGHREKTRIAAYYGNLVEHYKRIEDWNTVILLLKKVLEYEPSSRARSELVRVYRTKYESHSLLNEFLKMSDLTNHKKPVGPCIASFERNIVFDKGNFVHHRTRGVGKITEIDKDQMIIDFKDHPGQKMSIQMAISSLQPLSPEHIWVKTYSNPDEIQELFDGEIPLFLELLLSSFHNKITLAEIKAEASRFLKGADYTRWWAKARDAIGKNARFQFNPKNKNELILREREINVSDQLSLKFQSTADWMEKLEIALETLKTEDRAGAAHLCTQYYQEQEENKDKIKRLHSYLFLVAAEKASGDEVAKKISKQDVLDLLKAETAKSIIKIFNDSPVEFKKDLISLIVKVRQDYAEILVELLFLAPSNLRNTIVVELSNLGQKDALKSFLERAVKKSREYSDIFLWIAKQILRGEWTQDWVTFTKEEILLQVFRILKPLVAIEKKGTRLKNAALEAIFGKTNITVESIKQSVLPALLEKADSANLRKMAVLFKEIPYVPEAQKDNFIEFLSSIRSDFKMEKAEEEADSEESTPDLLPPDSVILASEAGLAKRKEYLDHLINVEMSANSRDIGEAQERGDLRENAEYKAAMERQTQLRAEVTRLNEELKKSRIIDPASVRTDIVTIGTVVTVERSGETSTYTILGPWEADAEKNIISYLSPLGNALIGKSVGEEASLDAHGLKISSISRASL